MCLFYGVTDFYMVKGVLHRWKKWAFNKSWLPIGYKRKAILYLFFYIGATLQERKRLMAVVFLFAK